VTNTADPIQAIREAIEAKDSAAFAKGYSDLTASCNTCHQGIGRSFIVIKKPTHLPVYRSVVFAAQAVEGRWVAGSSPARGAKLTNYLCR
jgi:hypothetical protein